MQYFAQQFSFTIRQVLNSIVSYEKSEQVQQANVFKCQTLTFHFSKYRIIQIHLSIYHSTRRSDRMRELIAAIIASILETTWRPGRSLSTTLL